MFAPMHKISIIIPIYNVEQYLPQCLKSVINQTYQNLEIILVDDGSTDACPQICEEFALKDNRIKLIHKKNGGLSDARNAGLKRATGDFISFIDSDDFVAVDFCEKLLKALLENTADVAECDFLAFDNDQDLEKFSTDTKEKIEVFETEAAVELLMKEYFKQTVWNKLYRREVLGHFEFPVGKINEDEFWTYKVFGNSKKLVKITDVLYFYRQQAASIMGKQYSLKRLDGLQALEERIGYMRENFPKLEHLAVQIFCMASMDHYIKIEQHPEIDPQKIFREKVVASVKKYDQTFILENSDWKAVFWYQLFIKTPGIYAKLRNLNEIRIKFKNKKV